MLPPLGPPKRQLSINSLAPNILTTLALCSGLTSIRFSLEGKFHLAVIAILVAAIFDTLDGRVARLLKGATKFGAELDSLSDFVSFGVAPALLLYFWSLRDVGDLGWIAVLAFSTCCALRLARFNTALDDPDRPAWTVNFFTGVPAPAAAALSMLFVVASFEGGDTIFRSPWLNVTWGLAVAFLMVSRLPTYSFKKVRVRRDFVLPLLVLIGLFVAMLMSKPWFTLVGLGLVYLASLPFSYMAHGRYSSDPTLGTAVPDATANPAATLPIIELGDGNGDRRLH